MFFIFVAMWQFWTKTWMEIWFSWFSQANVRFPKTPEVYIAEINAIWENSASLAEQETACFRIIEHLPGMPEKMRSQIQEILIFTAGQGYLKKAWECCTKTCGQAYT